MIYYGIVDKLKEEHYGEYKTDTNLFNKIYYGYNPASILVDNSLGQFFPEIKKSKQSRGALSKKASSERTLEKSIVIKHKDLKNTFHVTDNPELFNGLFDSLGNSGFKKIMTSYGGSDLIVIERENLPQSLRHYGGDGAIFTSGLYFQHPKDESLLIPLNNSNNLINSLVLEETIRAYEALGAKKIKITDITQATSTNKWSNLKIKSSQTGSYNKEVLREKHFGKGTFDPVRALDTKMFLHDFPAIMTTIEARIKGNQTIEKFTENINLSLGFDVEVLKLFSANANFDYNRRWSVEVEFYDKNEMDNITLAPKTE